MKPRLTVACSLVVLITVAIAAIQPTLVLGQPSNKIFLPLVLLSEGEGTPRFTQSEYHATLRDDDTEATYTVPLYNDGPAVTTMFLSLRYERTDAFPGFGIDFEPKQVRINPGSFANIQVRVTIAPNTQYGADGRTIRAASNDEEGPLFDEVDIITNHVPPVPPDPTQVQNGNFEAGRTGWKDFSLPLIEESSTAHSGQWQASLLSAPDDDTTLSQQIYLTPEHQALSFWYKIDSDDEQCENASGPSFIADYVVISAGAQRYPVNGTASSVSEYIPLCVNTDTNGQWVHKVLDISKFEDFSINISFLAVNNQYGISRFYVDDVELITVP